MGDWGAKVSLPGKSTSSSTPEDYALNSKFGSVKIAQEPPSKTAVTVTVSGSTLLTTTTEHDLGFIPLAMIFAERTPGSGRFFFGSVYAGGPDDAVNPVTIDSAYTDDTNLIVKFLNNKVTSQAVKFYYFIFGDSGE